MPRPVLSFAKLEEIVANLDDGRLAQAYQDPASVIPGVEIPQSLTNTEMKGRNQVRQAIEAMSQPTDTVADRNYGEFTGQGQQQQQGQGQPQPGQGMPQQQMAYGGLIGYQAGGEVPTKWYDKEIPYLSGLGEFVTGSRSLGEAARNPLRTVGMGLMTALPVGLAGKGALWAGRGLMSGRAAMGLAGKSGWRRGLGRFLGGRGNIGPSGQLRRVPGSRPDPIMGPQGAWPAGARDAAGRRIGGQMKPWALTQQPYARASMSDIGRRSALMAGVPAAGIMSLMAHGELTEAQMNRARDEAQETGQDIEDIVRKIIAEQGGGGGGGGSGGGSGRGALYDDMNKVASDRMRQYMRHEDWLRAETPEEAAVRDLQIQMADRLEGRIDPDRDRRDALATMAARAAQSITAEGRGRGGGADVMAEAALEQIGLGKEQRVAREDLEDQAFRFRAMGPEQAALRSRQSTVGEIDTVLSELQGDLGQLAQVDLSTARQLEGVLENARMQIERGQMFGPGEFEAMLTMAERAADDPDIPAVTQQRLANLVNMYYGMMEQRLAGEYTGQGQDLTTRYTR